MLKYGSALAGEKQVVEIMFSVELCICKNKGINYAIKKLQKLDKFILFTSSN